MGAPGTGAAVVGMTPGATVTGSAPALHTHILYKYTLHAIPNPQTIGEGRGVGRREEVSREVRVLRLTTTFLGPSNLRTDTIVEIMVFLVFESLISRPANIVRRRQSAKSYEPNHMGLLCFLP